jgi:hypothetical protein
MEIVEGLWPDIESIMDDIFDLARTFKNVTEPRISLGGVRSVRDQARIIKTTLGELKETIEQLISIESRSTGSDSIENEILKSILSRNEILDKLLISLLDVTNMIVKAIGGSKATSKDMMANIIYKIDNFNRLVRETPSDYHRAWRHETNLIGNIRLIRQSAERRIRDAAAAAINMIRLSDERGISDAATATSVSRWEDAALTAAQAAPASLAWETALAAVPELAAVVRAEEAARAAQEAERVERVERAARAAQAAQTPQQRIAALMTRNAAARAAYTPSVARYSFLDGEDEDVDSKDLGEYKKMMKCPLCLGNIKDVRLTPCGHMLCKTCIKDYLNKGFSECPICKIVFTNIDKLYYAKYLKYKNKYLQLKTKSF